MKTYILPGYSDKNKFWVDETVAFLKPAIPAIGLYWNHWDGSSTEDGWIEEEARRIINDSNNEKINIVAKSVGAMVCMAVLKLKPELVNKVILCGIPFKDFLPGDEKRYESLKSVMPNNILRIQNEEDNYGSFEKTESFVRSINPNIKVVSKPRNDHYYPYSEDFKNFLIENNNQ